MCGFTFDSWMLNSNELSRLTFLLPTTNPLLSNASTSCSLTSLLPTAFPSHRLLPLQCLPIDLSVCKEPERLICPRVLTLFHHVLYPLPRSLLINFLWLPDTLPPPLPPPLSALFSLAASLRSFFSLDFCTPGLLLPVSVPSDSLSLALIARACRCLFSLSSGWCILNQGLAESQQSVGENP